jgi:hypothetical protein
LKLKFFKEIDNIIYETSEGYEHSNIRMLAPFNAAFTKTEHLHIDNSIKNINSSSNEYLSDILIGIEEFK